MDVYNDLNKEKGKQEKDYSSDKEPWAARNQIQI